ncbi:zinc finger and BTB domain-containing protein 7C [Hypanus sabinus]|uniref:zinc finger and BTB domain-containing protein 7C n=1 Tax=Hypanus sabinus TaxID=79690 RepID=UPI0028C48824|nr:zinc finger and BTB domain-containing protein 7C [Hypanus sabinus]XP_059845740.1 zinc finger and BTB domain-containing protein 7C [Hypanus sabinus]XP_059845741.1 zinc finger and BTB domain-containing protein 7C [Hypanus sabinus]XP_059845742.1 zinc finger and BTB domain-containing protein 7C [Hypanus sabinus]XP_059845743.1 zinc finger and BTB domain-containing protein 7C [Hypanus sabinus]XP_059845745.1 zinc finger and BTB domain-containing protein 7C [Hypanus sabinus]XP_059845746.1 zinc fin
MKSVRPLCIKMTSTVEDLIGIPFPDHSNKLLCSLNEQRQEGLLCDVILIVKDQEYKTHRSILAACSKYFKTLFTSDMLAEQHNVYQIDFVTPEALSAILEFAYTSTLTISSSNVKDVLSAAQQLEIQCVIQVCIDIMEASGEVVNDDGVSGKESSQELEDDLCQKDIWKSPQQSLKEDHEENPQEPIKESDQNHWNKECDSKNTSTSKMMEKQCSELPREHLNHFAVNVPDRNLGSVSDFSLESILKEGLSSRGNLLNGEIPQGPGLFPSFWNGGYNGFPRLLEHQDVDQLPLNLVMKKEKIKQEVKEDLSTTTNLCDFFKGIMVENSQNNLETLKDELDFNSYLNIFGPSYLATVYPTWSLEYEKKMRPKASQQCPICNKVIQGAGKLPRHMRTHTGEKPYMCNICQVRFTRQDKLKIHMRKHTGERPYTCIHCSSRFVHNYDLKNHMRIHTGVRPYQCVHCFKSFTRSDHLHRHIKRLSCRLPRPRRGRKPAAWHSGSLLYPQGGPSQSTTSNENGNNILPKEEDRIPKASTRELDNTEKHFSGDSQNSQIFIGKTATTESESLMSNMLNGNHVVEERDRNLFTFSLTHSNAFPHLSRQIYSTSDPWGVQFNSAASIQETSK